MKFTYSIQIKSKPEVVFAWIANPERAMRWMKSVSKTEMLHETPEMVGSTFREIVSEDGQGVEMLGTVTEYEVNKTIGFHLESKVNIVDVTYHIEPNGNTRITQDACIRWKFPINVISIFAASKFKQNLLSQAAGEFGALKRLCEREMP
jgi:hypothetical protein